MSRNSEKSTNSDTMHRNPPRQRSRVTALVFVGSFGILVGLGFVLAGTAGDGPMQADQTIGPAKVETIQQAVEAALSEVLPAFRSGPANASGDRDLLIEGSGAGFIARCRTIRVGPTRSWTDIKSALNTSLEGTTAKLLWSEELPDQGLLRLDLGQPGLATHTLVLHRGERPPPVRWGESTSPSAWQKLLTDPSPVIALVIDDWGYGNNETTRMIIDLDVPLTLAVLPGMAYSDHFAAMGTDLVLPPMNDAGGVPQPDHTAARFAAGCRVNLAVGEETTWLDRRREIILHWPMQPESVWNPGLGKWAVYVGMDRELIEKRLTGALLKMPDLRGVNNHMGSAATKDTETMVEVMAVLKERGMFFIDSLTTPSSVAYQSALAAGIPALRNQAFLDSEPLTRERVRSKLQFLVRSAQDKGFALGLGHPLPLTAEVLATEIPRLRAAGVKFVTVSELLALQSAVSVPNS